jgi:hypothetical protein
MNIEEAKTVLLRTHIASIRAERRASGMYLESPPGIGKSEGARQETEELAKLLGEPVGLVVEMLATYSSVDVRGFMLPIKGEGGGLNTTWSTPAWYPVKANIHVCEPDGAWHRPGSWDGSIPRYGNLFLDEFAQAEDEVKKPAAELIYKGAVGTCELPLGWRVLAAGNRLSDRSGVLRELMFIVNRRCKLDISANLPAWLNWAQRQPDATRPHYLTLSFAQQNPGIVFADKVPDGTEPFCTPRTLCLMDQDLQALRSDEDIRHDRMPMDDLSRETAAGWIGGGSAGQYMTHIKYADELPSIEDIMRKPDEAKVPKGRDAQMVASYMIAHHVNDETAKPIMKYLTRLGVEMQVLAVKAASAEAKRAKALVVVPEYTSWLVRHKDTLIASQS